MPGGDPVLVDTGPLVALFDPSDQHHGTCKSSLAALRGRRLISTLAVVTEATYLLGFSVRAQSALLAFLEAKAVEIDAIGANDLGRVRELLERYADLPMEFADATLVVLSQRLRTMEIFTLDRRDFGVYRVGRRPFRIFP